MLFSWEAWVALCLLECLRPCLPDLFWLLDWPVWGGGLSPSLEGGRAVVELLPSPGGRIAIAWDGLPAMGELLPSLWGRWAIAGVRLLSSLGGRRAVTRRELLPSWEGRWAIAWELLPSWEGRWAKAWEEETKPVWEGFGPSPSSGGGRGLAGGCCCLPQGEGGACLPVLIITCLWKIVITVVARWPSYISFFLFTTFWNFLICLSLTLLKLVSPTLSTKPWHSLSLSVEMIDASWDLHSSIVLPCCWGCWCQPWSEKQRPHSHTLHTRSWWKYQKICGRYGIQTHFKGGRTSKTCWSLPRTKTLWSTKVVPSTGTNVGT